MAPKTTNTQRQLGRYLIRNTTISGVTPAERWAPAQKMPCIRPRSFAGIHREKVGCDARSGARLAGAEQKTDGQQHRKTEGGRRRKGHVAEKTLEKGRAPEWRPTPWSAPTRKEQCGSRRRGCPCGRPTRRWESQTGTYARVKVLKTTLICASEITKSRCISLLTFEMHARSR